MVKGKIYEEFIIQKHPPIYNPDQFAEFCHSAGAENIFNHILMSVTSERHSSSRQELNKRRTVCIIYKMCYCLSQLCNIMQVDHAIYLNSNNVNQEGMDIEFQLGNTCSRKTSHIKLNKLSNDHHNNLETFFSEAIKNEWLLLLIIDDFTKIHTRHLNPSKLSKSQKIFLRSIIRRV